MGTEPTPFELKPRFYLTKEDNKKLCIKQLEKVFSGDMVEKFNRSYMLREREGSAEPLAEAAADCGLSIHWSN